MICDDRLIEVMDDGHCLARTEVYSRVCGFFRPVQQWNLGKRDEFRQRVPFKTD